MYAVQEEATNGKSLFLILFVIVFKGALFIQLARHFTYFSTITKKRNVDGISTSF